MASVTMLDFPSSEIITNNKTIITNNWTILLWI